MINNPILFSVNVICWLSLIIVIVFLGVNTMRTVAGIFSLLDSINEETKPNHLKSEIFATSKFIVKNQIVLLMKNLTYGLLLILAFSFAITFTNCKSHEKNTLENVTAEYDKIVDSLSDKVTELTSLYHITSYKVDSLKIVVSTKDSIIGVQDSMIKTYSGLKQENQNLRNAIEHQNNLIRQWGIK